MTATMTPIGPTMRRKCGWCQGRGFTFDAGTDIRTACPCCDGSGGEDVAIHPFVTLGAAVECLQAIRTSMRLRRTQTFKPPIGSPAYYVDAVEDRLGELFQQLAVMLPAEYDRTEAGDA